MLNKFANGLLVATSKKLIQFLNEELFRGLSPGACLRPIRSALRIKCANSL